MPRGRAAALGLLVTGAAALAGCGATPAAPRASSSAPSSSTTTSTPGLAGGGPAPTTASSAPPTATGREQIPAFSHLFVVVMENEERQGALSSPDVAGLARRYASAVSWYAVAHPSLPNYLAMVSGSTWGVTADCTTCFQNGPNLGAQLSTAGISWGAYLQDAPGPCFLGPQSPDGLYAEKHNPFAYFDDVRDDPALCAHLRPLSALTPLLAPGAPAAGVPRFVWVTPNLCNDGHNCSDTVSGPWLAGFVATVTASAAWADGGALVVTWDEGVTDAGIDPSTGAVGTAGGGGNVLTLVIAPGVRPGLQVTTPYDHYSLLRTVEDAFGLPLLGAAADPSTRAMSAFWTRPS